eukprot:357562_1
MAEEKKADGANVSYLLIAGTTKSPKSVQTSDKKRDNGDNATSRNCDLVHMEKYLKKKPEYTLYNTLRDFDGLTCVTVLNNIKQCAQKTNYNGEIIIYYTGHGETNTGNWCFVDGTINLLQVLQSVRNANKFCEIMISASCSFSGNWCIELAKYKDTYKGINIFAASWPGKRAYDTKNGGFDTLTTLLDGYMSGLVDELGWNENQIDEAFRKFKGCHAFIRSKDDTYYMGYTMRCGKCKEELYYDI